MDNIDVIFTGRVRDGFEVADVRDTFARQFKVPGTALDKIFDGDEFTLNRNLDQATADKLCAVLRHFGMIVRAEQPEHDFGVDLSAFVDQDSTIDSDIDEGLEPETVAPMTESPTADAPASEPVSADSVEDLISFDEDMSADLDVDMELVPLANATESTTPAEGRAEYEIDDDFAEPDIGPSESVAAEADEMVVEAAAIDSDLGLEPLEELDALDDVNTDEQQLEDTVDQVLDDALESGELSLEPLDVDIDQSPEAEIAEATALVSDLSDSDGIDFLDDLDLDTELDDLDESAEPAMQIAESLAADTVDADLEAVDAAVVEQDAEPIMGTLSKTSELDQGSHWRPIVMTLVVLAIIGAALYWWVTQNS